MEHEEKRFKQFGDIIDYFGDVNNAMAEAICFLSSRLKLISELKDVDFDWDKLLDKNKKPQK